MRRRGAIAFAVGVVLLAATAFWVTSVVPQLVKFPTDTNTTLHYGGRMVVFVDQKTGASLVMPKVSSLTIDRTMKALPQSTSSVAVVDERFVVHSGGTTQVEHNRYALDRRTMQNVTSADAFTLAPGNPGASAGSYYVTLPMGTSATDRTMQIWKPETSTTYPLIPLRPGSQPTKLNGLSVYWFSGTLPMTPVTSAELKVLAAAGLPMSASPQAVAAQLTAAGMDIPALTRALAPVLSATEAAQVLKVMSSPVPLHYYAFSSGIVAVEPATGAVIDIKNAVDGIAYSPSTAGLKTLVTVLSRHTNVAGVRGALRALRSLASGPPQPVYELQYSQTPASVASMVSTAKSQADQINLVSFDIPLGVGILGGVLLLLGAADIARRRSGRRPQAAVPPPAERPAGKEAA